MMIDWNGNGKIDPVDVGITLASEPPICEENITLLGYTFNLIQELNPHRGLTGKIKLYDPKAQYSKKETTPLNKHGEGPFCRFSLNSLSLWGVKGVYALLDTERLLYIGQTVNLAQRFNSGYGIIEPINCYAGGQSTNCKINAMILQKYQNGERVFLFFFETFDYDRVEHKLIEALNPPFNSVSLPLSTASSCGQKRSNTISVQEKQSFENTWNRILSNVGDTFYTGGRKLEFTYKVHGDAIVSSRAQTTPLTKDNFNNAFLILNTVSSTEFNKKIMGSSYVKAILSDPRIRVK